MSNLEEFTWQIKNTQSGILKKNTLTTMFFFYAFKYLLIFPLSLYNIVFIPLQMGFFMQFSDWSLFLEVLTMLSYSIDTILILRHYMLLKMQFQRINETTERKSFEKEP